MTDQEERRESAEAEPASSQTGVARRRLWRAVRLVIGAAVVVVGLLFVFDRAFLEWLLRSLFPATKEVVYPRASLPQLLGAHLVLVGVSSVAAAAVGIPLGIFVTRRSGRDFLPLVQDLSSLAQTFPPVAVLALAVPALGFGFKPAVAALFLYSILPVINNTISGLRSVPALVLDASRGMGMTPIQTLFYSELPLAARVIAAGVRTSVVINVGTATVGAVAGAGGLGVAIVGGLVRDNTAFVLEGAVTAALLALSVDWLLARVERLFYSPQRERSAHR
ncbi:ABC transporter permease [Salinispira pacifica]